MLVLQMNNLTAIDFYKPTKYNPETLNQIWMSEIADSHDIWCDCNGPFAHLLASIFPPGHKDRDLTISQILKRDFKQCLSGGDAGESAGGAAGTASHTIKPEREELSGNQEEENIEDLLAAAEDAERR